MRFAELRSSEDDLKAFLYEMVVVGQDFQYPLASHGRHGDAVHKAVALVIALLMQTQGRQKGFARLRMNRHPPVVHDSAEHPSDRFPQMPAALSQAVKKFGEHLVGRNQAPPERGLLARGIDRVDEVPHPSRACARRPASLLFRCTVEVVVEISEVVAGDFRPLSG